MKQSEQKAKPKKKTGRPKGSGSKYTPEIGIQVCKLISQGQSLRTIAKEKGMPPPSTVIQWVIDIPEFAERYARAKEEQLEVLIEEMIDITEEKPESPMDINRNRLRIDTRKWIASKLKPKKYGDVQRIEGKLEYSHTVDDQLFDGIKDEIRRNKPSIDDTGPDK